MTQDRFELKVDGKYITLDQLYDLAKDEIVSELDCMGTEDALCLGNLIREQEDYDLLYKNNEECINDQLSDWNPWDIVQLDYDDYADFFVMDYGEPAFTSDVWYDLDTEEIAENILDGAYSNYINSDIEDILDDYEEAKEFLEKLNPYRVMCEEVIARYVNCEADVTDLLQLIDKLAKNDDCWAEE